MATPIFEVTEGSNCGLYMEFFAHDGVAFTPTTVYYTVNDESTGTELVSSTLVSPLGVTATAIIPIVANTLISRWKKAEVHVITIIITYGSDRYVEEVRYTVNRARFV